MNPILSTTLFLAFAGVMAAAGFGCQYQPPAAVQMGETVGIAGVSSGQTTRVAIHSRSMDAITAFVSFHSADGCLLKSERVMVGAGKIVTVDLTGHEIAAATGSLRSNVVATVAFEPGPDGSQMSLSDVLASMEIFHSGTGDTVALIRAERDARRPVQVSDETPAAFSKQSIKVPSTCAVELDKQEAKLKQYYDSLLQKTQADAEKALAKQVQESKSKIDALEAKLREAESKKPPTPTPGSSGGGKAK